MCSTKKDDDRACGRRRAVVGRTVERRKQHAGRGDSDDTARPREVGRVKAEDDGNLTNDNNACTNLKARYVEASRSARYI